MRFYEENSNSKANIPDKIGNMSDDDRDIDIESDVCKKSTKKKFFHNKKKCFFLYFRMMILMQLDL